MILCGLSVDIVFIQIIVTKIITNHSSYDIRYTLEQDAEPLRSWLVQESVLYWFPMSTESEVDMFIKNWIGCCNLKCSITALVDTKAVGVATLFIVPCKKMAHLSMGYVVVDPLFQKKGIGTSLTRNLVHLAKDYFSLESIYFEVYEKCPIISILQKQGFHEIFHQDKFVKMGTKYLARKVLDLQLKK